MTRMSMNLPLWCQAYLATTAACLLLVTPCFGETPATTESPSRPAVLVHPFHAGPSNSSLGAAVAKTLADQIRCNSKMRVIHRDHDDNAVEITGRVRLQGTQITLQVEGLHGPAIKRSGAANDICQLLEPIAILAAKQQGTPPDATALLRMRQIRSNSFKAWESFHHARSHLEPILVVEMAAALLADTLADAVLDRKDVERENEFLEELRQRLGTAQPLAEQALALDASYGPAHSLTAFYDFVAADMNGKQTGEISQSTQLHLAQARKICPDYPMNWQTEAALTQIPQQLDEAIDAYPNDVELLLYQAIQWLGRSRFKPVLARTSRALQLEPNNQTAYQLHVRALGELRDQAPLRRFAGAWAKRNPDNMYNLVVVFGALEHARQHDAAAEVLATLANSKGELGKSARHLHKRRKVSGAGLSP